MASLRALVHEAEIPEGDAARENLKRLAESARDIAGAMTFEPRAVAVWQILGRFAAWKVSDVPLEFDALYDAPVSTEELQDWFARAVQAPVVLKAD